MRLILKGVQRYWFYAELISILAKKTGSDEAKTREFLSKNSIIYFNQISRSSAVQLLDQLVGAGFEIHLEESKEDIFVTLGMTYEAELGGIRKEMNDLSSRLKRLEEIKGVERSASSLQESPVYQKLKDQKTEYDSKPIPAIQELAAKGSSSQGTAESNIGKYWLSRIGIFTLVLGIVLFISYSFQFIGPWGKILVGLIIGSSLTGSGNYLTRNENYKRWAMAMIGGGWAILYFTVYAAYQIPVTRVITNPLAGFFCLLLVILGSITQSLKFKSQALVFFSYFLGFIALVMVEVSFYTLAASFLLGVSTVIVTRKMGWTWLALLGLAAVYLTHYFWLTPALSSGPSPEQQGLWDILILPWAGENWRVYPLMTSEKSLLHQAFLILYWILFTAIGFFKNEKQNNENLAFWLLLSNSFIFVTSYIHHLHIYHPALKYLFPLVMGFVFLGLSWAEQRSKKGLLSDLYLAFSVMLFVLTVPMYFDGPWITYGWIAGMVILSWLGVWHSRKILSRMSWVLGSMVILRLICFDYLETKVLFTFLMPVRLSFVIFMTAAVAFGIVFWIYWKSHALPEQEKRITENSFLIGTAFALGCGFLIGGFRASASVIWVFEGAALMILGVMMQRKSLRFVAMIYFIFASFRIASVDCGLEITKLLFVPKVGLRLISVGLSIGILLWLSDWLRRGIKVFPVTDKFLTILGALLVMRYFYDEGISSWVSIIWGGCAFGFIVAGFTLKDRLYRWCGLGMFFMVLLRLFFHDFSTLSTIYRIISFIGLGVVFIGASFLYSYCSKLLLDQGSEK